LLVERARNIYSFSHLTFQQYFTAQEIERERQLGVLVQNITDPRWKEVFYLTSEMLRRSDDFLRMMKSQIDGMFAVDEKLQSFLEWINAKTNSVQCNYKTVAIRAFYMFVAFHELSLNLARTLDLNFDIAFSDSMQLDTIRALIYSLIKILDTTFDLALDLILILIIDRAFMLTLDHGDIYLIYSINLHLEFSIDTGNNVWQQSVNELRNMLPQAESNHEAFYQWWRENGKQWVSEFRQLCIVHRNIGHDWQFTDEQVELLKQYYAANILLVECMNRSDVSKEVREEIESTLLLPVGVIDS